MTLYAVIMIQQLFETIVIIYRLKVEARTLEKEKIYIFLILWFIFFLHSFTLIHYPSFLIMISNDLDQRDVYNILFVNKIYNLLSNNS